MKAVIISKKGHIEYKEVQEPKIKKGYVKVKVKAAGLCGSDTQKIFSDKKSLRLVKTSIWGHEISGVIYETGKEVKNFVKGDKVIVNSLIRNDEDSDITKIRSLGKDLPGGFADYIVVPYKNLRKIPSNIGFEEAILTDSIAVALHGYHLSNSPTNKNILILGDGSLGLITGLLCLEFNNKVTLIGKNIRNLKLASDFGITALRSDQIKDLQKNYDIIFEIVGRKQDNTLDCSIQCIKPNGQITVLGVFEKGYYGNILLRELFYKEGKIVGSNSYGFFNGKSEFDMAINFLKKMKLQFSQLITHVLPLKEFKTGLDLIKNKKSSKAIKIVFKP